MADPIFPVEAPTRTPRRGGIRSVAEFRTDNRIGLGGKLVYTSADCSLAVGEAVLCYPSPAPAQTPKTRDGVSQYQSVLNVFGGYYGVECWLDGEEYEAVAREGLDRGSDRLIESYLRVWIDSKAASGTPETLVEAIGMADAHADLNYAGAPILLMDRADAVRAGADGALDFDKDGNLWTPNGTRVVSSGQFTEGNVGVTGALTVYETDPVVSRTRDLTLNTELAIAERTFGILADCNFAARFVVTPTP